MKFYIHQYNNANPNREVSGIKVIPIHDSHRRFVMIDTQTLRSLTSMRNTNLEKQNPRKSDVWNHSFDFSSVKKNNQYFDCKIMSNIISVCIHMIKTNVLVDVDLPKKGKEITMRIYDPPKQEPPFDQRPDTSPSNRTDR